MTRDRERIDEAFRTRLAARDFPVAPPTRAESAASKTELFEVFESALMSRRLDLLARRLGKEKRGFYSIGSAGHEANAMLARVFRRDDMAFLHYRSGAFLIERLRKVEGSTPLYDISLSLVAAADDPVSGGRHKVLGSKAAFVPPQTSTIASHLPKAVGAAFAITLARSQKRDDMILPRDGVIYCSFGDASANHSTSQGAFNAAAWAAHQNSPMPIVFVCEDNGIGISVPTPKGWIAANFAGRAGLTYIACDGRDLHDVRRAGLEAQQCARLKRKPVFLHMKTVRLMGHAGSDVEATYRAAPEIEAVERDDPLLHFARQLVEAGVASADDILALDDQIDARLTRIAEDACRLPKLSTARDIAASVVPPAGGAWRAGRPRARPDAGAAKVSKADEKAKESPQHMSRMISLALSELMAGDDRIVVFGEDVGRKGGVYGATVKLQQTFGPRRVIDTLLDEQTILGFAIGLAHDGFLPIPEIQFLAYVHNAEDQIRGEAATLPYFSNGQFANPMVIRIAGLAYQRGFGGHFHNDNGMAVFRDIPGLIVACPSNAADAARLLRESVRLADEDGRVVVFLEPIALYGVKDLHDDGDGLMAAPVPAHDDRAPFGEPAVHGDGRDVAIVTYGNGCFLSRRAARTLKSKHGVDARVIDLRWLKPLHIDAVIDAAKGCRAILIVDECRGTGSPSEELVTGLVERGVDIPLRRVVGCDSFVPLGTAAYAILPSEDDIVAAATAVVPNKAPSP